MIKHPQTGQEIVIKDVIADAFLQQILLKAKEYDVIATLNLNGDYNVLAAQVGGIGIAPGKVLVLKLHYLRPLMQQLRRSMQVKIKSILTPHSFGTNDVRAFGLAGGC